MSGKSKYPVPGPTFGIGEKTNTTGSIGEAWGNRYAGGSKDNIWNWRNPLDPLDSHLRDFWQDFFNLEDSDRAKPEKAVYSPVDLSRGPIVQGGAPRYKQVPSKVAPPPDGSSPILDIILAALGGNS